MKTIAIFLRGINVNGIKIKMDALKSVIEASGYREVKTILSTGNVIATTDDDGKTLEDHTRYIEEVLREYFSYEAHVIVKEKSELEAICNEANNHLVPEGYHHYLLLSNDESLGEELRELFVGCEKEAHEALIVNEKGIFWIVPKGSTLKSIFGVQVLGKKKFKSRLTSRTMNTIVKVNGRF